MLVHVMKIPLFCGLTASRCTRFFGGAGGVHNLNESVMLQTKPHLHVVAICTTLHVVAICTTLHLLTARPAAGKVG